jgi:hypothetical protein
MEEEARQRTRSAMSKTPRANPHGNRLAHVGAKDAGIILTRVPERGAKGRCYPRAREMPTHCRPPDRTLSAVSRRLPSSRTQRACRGPRCTDRVLFSCIARHTLGRPEDPGRSSIMEAVRPARERCAPELRFRVLSRGKTVMLV